MKQIRQLKHAAAILLIMGMLGCSSRQATPFAVCTYGWQLIDTSQRNAFVIAPSNGEDCALTIGCFQSTNVVSREQLYRLSFVATPSNITRHVVSCGDFSGYAASYTNDDTHWDAWWIACSNAHLYITFNSTLPPSTNDLATARRIVNSLIWRRSQQASAGDVATRPAPDK